MSTAYTPCQCGCRPETATAPGCACPECQPGPGLHDAGADRRRDRMMTLLQRKYLTEIEEAELDGLFDRYVHGD